MAHIASSVNIPDGEYNRVIKIEKRNLSTLAGETSEMAKMAKGDWQYPIVKYLRDPFGQSRKSYRFSGSS